MCWSATTGCRCVGDERAESGIKVSDEVVGDTIVGEEFDMEDEMACLSSANEMTSFRKLVCGWGFGLMFRLCDLKRFLRCKNRGSRFASAETNANCTANKFALSVFV